MRFHLVDRILELVPGKRIRAVKNLTLGEEYLADHFPTFPVMPGVLMLEALLQSGAWLLRVTEDFAHSVIVLREVKGIKYGHFVEPGRQLRLEAEILEQNMQSSAYTAFKGKGDIDGTTTVSGRFVLERYNLRDRRPALASIDEQLVAHYRSLYVVVGSEKISASD